MKKSLKVMSMITATFLALHSNANAGGPGVCASLAIGGAVAGAAIIGAAGAAGVTVARNIDDIKEFDRNRCTSVVAGKNLGWRTCCSRFKKNLPGCKNDTNPPTGTITNPNPPRCDLFPNSPICNNPDPKRCDLFPNLPACTPGTGGGGGNGVSEPIGILAGLTALSMFFIARRRK